MMVRIIRPQCDTYSSLASLEFLVHRLCIHTATHISLILTSLSFFISLFPFFVSLHLSVDGFLYVVYSGENTFGDMEGVVEM